MSASWFPVEMCSIVMVLLMTWEQKEWRKIAKCFVQGKLQWSVAIFEQVRLSSNVHHSILGVSEWMENFMSQSSSSRWIMLMTSCNNEDRAMYSASVMLSAISDCMMLFHKMGHHIYMIIKLVCKWECIILLDEWAFQVPPTLWVQLED